jgi:hypothetical protein
MSVPILVYLFICMTFFYFSYSTISYKVLHSCIGDMFLCSLSVHHLEVHVLHEHDPLIFMIRHRKSCIRLYE